MSFIRGFLVRRRTEDIFFINLCCMNRQAMKKVYSRIEAARNIGRRWRGLGSMDPALRRAVLRGYWRGVGEDVRGNSESPSLQKKRPERSTRG